MITIEEVSFVVIVQTIIFLIILCLFLLFLLHKKQQRITEYRESKEDEGNASPIASVENYLTTEVKVTESRFNALYKDEDRDVMEFIEPDWLVLRQKYLELEKELLTSTEREDEFWFGLEKLFRKLLSDSYLFKRIKAKESDEDGVGVENINIMKLMKEQDEEYEQFMDELDNEDKELSKEELKAKLLKINASHKELTYCMFILEDENKFLQNHVKELLDSENNENTPQNEQQEQNDEEADSENEKEDKNE